MEPPRVAIVGAGPAGIYAAQSLVDRSPTEIQVDIYDRLPTPYGLLRYGVAPDHTSIKAVATRLAQVFESPQVRFVGHVNFGTDVTADDLLGAYHAVIYAAGASEDKEMGVPGEHAVGVEGARTFVAWYSGHPDAEAHDLAGVHAAVTVGVGNVAVDVARILSKTASELASTDMPESVLQELAGHRIKDVWLIGRRGPAQASFTTLELRELLNLDHVQPIIDPADLDGIDEDELDRRTKANLAALRAAADKVVAEPRQRLHLLFWHRPVRVVGDPVTALVLERTRLDDSGTVVGTGEETTIECELVLRAIGYRGVPLPGVPFDVDRSVIPCADGRVIADGMPAARQYAVGWIKRGPIGVIGTNKSDAVDTVTAVLSDLETSEATPSESPEQLWARRALTPTTYHDWQQIEAAETALGQRRGRDRTKIEAWSELLDIATRGRPGGPAIPGDAH